MEIPLREVFAYPTVAQLEPRLSQLKEEGNRLSLPGITAREVDSDLLPNATYNIPGAICLSGNLDVSALEKSLGEIVRRHEVLRTSFTSENSKPRQVIDPDISLKLEMVDLQQETKADRENKLQELVNEEASTPFNLELAPLVRCSLLQLEASEYILLVTMHHIISDGWSRGVLIEAGGITNSVC